MTAPDDTYGDEALAAEYVLHLLDAPERQAFEDRLRDEAPLRDEVIAWEARLAPLAADVAEVTPPARVKAAILARLAPDAPRRKSLFTGLRLALLGIAAAAAVALFLFGPFPRGPQDLVPEFQAEIASAERDLVIVAGVIPETHEMVIEQVEGGPPEGRVLELWLIPEGEETPVSLGVLEEDGSTRIRVPDEIAPDVRSGTVAVSDEPPGGSPTGSPTGTVLATGTFTDL